MNMTPDQSEFFRYAVLCSDNPGLHEWFVKRAVRRAAETIFAGVTTALLRRQDLTPTERNLLADVNEACRKCGKQLVTCTCAGQWLCPDCDPCCGCEAHAS